MRKITKAVCSAFMNKNTLTIGNTHTDGKTLFLFGNAIAEWRNNTELWITNAGWPTTTTRERLNGLPNIKVWQSKGEQLLITPRNTTIIWNGDWIRAI